MIIRLKNVISTFAIIILLTLLRLPPYNNKLGSMKYVAMGCPRKHRDTQGRVFARPRNFKHGVRCCGEIIPCKTPECSIGKKTFDEALLICKNLNMELCDTDQLNSCCNYYSSDANCGYDSEWVWVKNHGKYC